MFVLRLVHCDESYSSARLNGALSARCCPVAVAATALGPLCDIHPSQGILLRVALPQGILLLVESRPDNPRGPVTPLQQSTGDMPKPERP